MAYKASNPAKTALIMNMVSIALILIFQILLLIVVIKLYTLFSKEGDLSDVGDFLLAWCGMCVLWPLFQLYLVTASAIGLRGRNVYGKKHATATFVSFILVIVGVLIAYGGSFLFWILFGWEVGFPIVVTLPVILMAIGLFFFIKDIGGMLWGMIGAGVTSLAQLLLMVLLVVMTNSDDLGTMETMALISSFMVILTMIGLVLLGVGYVMSILWCNKNKPLIDEQQAQQLEMQQQQLSLQQQQLEMQQQQLEMQQKTTEMIQAKDKEQIPDKTG